MPTLTWLLAPLTLAGTLVACTFEPAPAGGPPGAVDAAGSARDAAIPTPPVDAACPGGDGDGDGVADSCDPCPSDSANDADRDGVCGDVDDWPCGARPSLPAVPSWNNGTLELVTVGHANIEGDGPLRVVDGGAALDVTAGYSIYDCQCPNCVDQIQVGLVDGAGEGGKQGCLYNGNPQGGMGPPVCFTPTANVATVRITAPTTPGRHDLRFRRGNGSNCGAQTTWWDNVVPDGDTTFGVLCVR